MTELGRAELHGCVSEIRSLRCTVTWPRSVAGVARLLGRDQFTGVARLLGRDQVTDVCTVTWPRSQGGTRLGV